MFVGFDWWISTHFAISVFKGVMFVAIVMINGSVKRRPQYVLDFELQSSRVIERPRSKLRRHTQAFSVN